jgi:hypothetical protein
MSPTKEATLMPGGTPGTGTAKAPGLSSSVPANTRTEDVGQA